MLAPTDERKLLRPRIPNIHGDVPGSVDPPERDPVAACRSRRSAKYTTNAAGTMS